MSRRRITITVGALVFLACVFSYVSGNGLSLPENPSPPTARSYRQAKVCTPAFEAKMARVVKEMNEGSLLGRAVVRTSTLNEVYVHPELWAAIDAEQKQNLTHNLSGWHNCVERPKMGAKLGKADYYHGVTLIDMMSGKKLATIGAFRGYRVF
ncbi:MAG: hypothetical protein OXG58_06765 [Gemmatimonadetes bacterium]|nr:hypothetical protein [Gemmatimonadota bacterium]